MEDKKEVKITPSAETEENVKRPEEFNLHIESNLDSEKGVWNSKWQDENLLWEGVGNTPLDSMRNLLNNVELEGIKDEKKKYNRYLALHFEQAKALCLQIKDILGKEGGKWFSVYALENKTVSMERDHLLGQLQLLHTYGLVKKKDNGKGSLPINSTWKINNTRELQIKELEDRKNVHEMELKQIQFQLENLTLKKVAETE